MIALVTGKVGGGKTLFAVGEMFRHMVAGGTCATNVSLVWEEVAALAWRRHGVRLERDQLRVLDLNENESWHESIPWGDAVGGCPVLVVLDEIHLWFNSRDWAATHKKHALMLEFISQCRKCGVELRFICQSASRLEKQFREQCEFEFFTRHVKDIKVPLLGQLPFNRFLRVKRDMGCEGTPKALERSVVAPDRDLFVCYRSYSFLTARLQGEDAARERVMRRVLVRRSVWSGVLPVVLRRLAYFVGFVGACATYKFFHS